MTKLKFCGAARAVTGSCHLLETAKGNILIDCGMRQGEDARGEYGEDSFPFNPADIAVLLLTHAHIDHTGLVPLIVKRGFAGPILCTSATAELATIMLPDSAHIQEQEAEWQNRKLERAGKKRVEPLYTIKDAEKSLRLFHGTEYGKRIEVLPGVTAEFSDVGHLLGSASIEVSIAEDNRTTKIVFSGDLGRNERPILNDPQPIREADYLVLESTYGDRDHEFSTGADKEAEFASVIRGALARGGNLVIPSFAVGRTQELLYYIKSILTKGLVPGLEKVPVYIDSPLAIEATKIYEHCARGYYDSDALALSRDGSPFEFPTLRIAQSTDESRAINDIKGQKIILSASGMCEAGRIRHHLKHNLYRADSTVMFAGYQAAGTLGRMLVDGAKKVRLFGEDVRVNANIVQTDGFSGHAGKSELIGWASSADPRPAEVFLVHGEDAALQSLDDALTSLGFLVTVPSLGDEVALVPAAGAAGARPARKSARAVPPPAAAKAGGTRPAQDAATPLACTAPEYAGNEQLKRLSAALMRSQDRRSPDTELKRAIFEADLKSLADKWDTLLP